MYNSSARGRSTTKPVDKPDPTLQEASTRASNHQKIENRHDRYVFVETVRDVQIKIVTYATRFSIYFIDFW